jgi:hypothetical protein
MSTVPYTISVSELKNTFGVSLIYIFRIHSKLFDQWMEDIDSISEKNI